MAIYDVRSPALPLSPIEYDQRQQDQFQNALRLYFNRLDNYNLIASVPAFGSTADRPTLKLQIGQFYFDTTLGFPIWYNGNDWVDATGSVV